MKSCQYRLFNSVLAIAAFTTSANAHQTPEAMYAPFAKKTFLHWQSASTGNSHRRCNFNNQKTVTTKQRNLISIMAVILKNKFCLASECRQIDWSVALSANFTVANLSLNRKQSILSPYVTAGWGYMSFRAKVCYTLAGNTGNFDLHWFIPVGAGLKPS